MKFIPIKSKEEGLLTDKELKELTELIDRGNSLLDKLENEMTYDKLKKLITKYARAVNKRRELLEGVVERTLKTKPSLSVHLNQIIKNTQELILVLKQARVINRYFNPLIKRLKSLLAKYKVFLNLDLTIKFHKSKTLVRHHKIVLGFDDLSIDNLISLILNKHGPDIKTNFLRTEADVIESGVMVDFITGINKDELKLAVKEDSEHSEFLFKAYVVLNHQVKGVNRLVELMNEYSVVSNESELDANIELLNNELKQVVSDLVKALRLLRKAREKKVITERLISVYNETELIRDAYEIIKSYLRYKFKVPDLLDQLRYEYLATYNAVPSELESYNEFSNRSKYVFLKKFFN